ncbi:MAG: cytochrome c3 family protein, partial [Verrucomicrobiota bacterium]|nr:cytochrome c3 family protein [Verrucomicrobiota bacterium]
VHATVSSCRDCHVAAPSSRLTSDVLIPKKESCLRCHNPTGLAQKASECMTCHFYHAPDPGGTSLAASNGSFKQMLLIK